MQRSGDRLVSAGPGDSEGIQEEPGRGQHGSARPSSHALRVGRAHARGGGRRCRRRHHADIGEGEPDRRRPRHRQDRDAAGWREHREHQRRHRAPQPARPGEDHPRQDLPRSARAGQRAAADPGHGQTPGLDLVAGRRHAEASAHDHHAGGQPPLALHHRAQGRSAPGALQGADRRLHLRHLAQPHDAHRLAASQRHDHPAPLGPGGYRVPLGPPSQLGEGQDGRHQLLPGGQVRDGGGQPGPGHDDHALDDRSR